MKKTGAIKLCEEKIAELKSTIASLKTNETISKSTRGTQLYARGRERRVLKLIQSLCSQIDDIKLDEDDMNTFVLITTLASERKVFAIEAKAGDSIFSIMEAHPNKSINQIESSLSKQGLAIDKAKMIVVAVK